MPSTRASTGWKTKSPSGFLASIGALSPDGKCSPFEELANGYVRGEGCVFVVCCTKEKAKSLGLPILAEIKGTAINHDGASAGLTAPNRWAQESVIKAAIKDYIKKQ